MTEAIFKSRRDFLAGTAAAVTVASMPMPAFAASGMRHFAARPLLVLYQAHDAHASAFADEFDRAGFSTFALTDDPVRQWRDGLGRLVRDENLLLLGLTNWSDYSMLRGLAAEERRFPLFESRRNKQTGDLWARRHAQAVLACADAEDVHQALRELGQSSQAAEQTRGMFSWAF